MSTFKSVTDFFDRKGPEDLERFVDKNLDISQQVFALLDEKGWSQKDLAKKIGKSDAEISKWLSGTHNLTLRSIAKLETALKADVILTPIKAQAKFGKPVYFTVKMEASINQRITAHNRFDPIVCLESSEQPTPSPQAA